jgi:hypothetical protein
MVLVTSAPCTGKENSVHHQIKFPSGVGASLHQRNLVAFSPAAFAARHGFFPGSQIHRQRGVSVMAEKSRNSPNKTEDQPLVKPQFFAAMAGVERC